MIGRTGYHPNYTENKFSMNYEIKWEHTITGRNRALMTGSSTSWVINPAAFLLSLNAHA